MIIPFFLDAWSDWLVVAVACRILLRYTVRVPEAVPISELRWCCLCVAMMKPAFSKVGQLAKPRRHSLILKANEPPGWMDSWVKNIPFVGDCLNLLLVIPQFMTELEDVVYFLAEDLESRSTGCVGRKLGMKQREGYGIWKTDYRPLCCRRLPF